MTTEIRYYIKTGSMKKSVTKMTKEVKVVR